LSPSRPTLQIWPLRTFPCSRSWNRHGERKGKEKKERKKGKKGRQFQMAEEKEENSIRDLRAIPQNTFQDAFQKWKKQKRCIKSGAEYFEGDKVD